MERNDTPIIIDVEASGFGRGSYPIEIGIVLTDASRHCFLIAPPRAWTYWDSEAEKVHGISRDLLASHGRPVHDVAGRLNELLRNRTAYSDAWAFDMSWVGKLYEAADLQQAFRIADIADLIEYGQLARWQSTKDEVAATLGLRRHRASGDARILRETWRRFHREAASAG